MCHLHRDGNDSGVDVHTPFNGIDRFSFSFVDSFNVSHVFHKDL